MEQSSPSPQNQAACQICGRTEQLSPAALLRPAIADLIRAEHSNFEDGGWICERDVKHYRQLYVESLLEADRTELGALERAVLESLRQNEILSRDPMEDAAEQLTAGQRLADAVARFAGSWPFIMLFFGLLVCWMFVNSFVLIAQPFDPYPYILLNLLLSCLAAIQAPLIMMSQQRQETRDRLRAQHDYQVNLKAELEIRQLHQKIDHLLSKQWERLVAIQAVQLELLDDLRGRQASA